MRSSEKSALRGMPWVMTCLVLVSLAGCGNEAPTYLPGDVVVTSTPAGLLLPGTCISPMAIVFDDPSLIDANDSQFG